MSSDKPAEFQGRLSEGKDWREIVAWVGDLPPMPQVAAKAIAMVEDPDTSGQDLNDLLSQDGALAARVLKIANSAMFSRQREIATLGQAVMIIGFKALKGIIVAATLRQMSRASSKLDGLVWEHSVATAICSTLIARKLKKIYVDEVFLLGLLHSVGQIVLSSQADTSTDYKESLKIIESQGIDYCAVEEQLFGFSHPLIGALVAKKWNFSADTCQVILHYRDQLDGTSAESELDEKIALVKAADCITHMASIGSPKGYPDQSAEASQALQYLGIQPSDQPELIEELIATVQQQVQQEGSIYT